MKKLFIIIAALTFLYACKEKPGGAEAKPNDIRGTWKLISGKTIDKHTGKTSEYRMNFEMIKVINDTHFAFVKHSTDPKDSLGFDAGGGSYTLNGNAYTEHLQYYKNKKWEGQKFAFKITVVNDTLTQTGVEKVEKEGVDRVIIEKYIKENK